jgi:glycosyltransferase involved in cell wall biosynthesis
MVVASRRRSGSVYVAFNVAGFLPTAIQSVLEQTHSDWSLVVVDDGSTDATAAAGARFQDKRIRLIRQPNSGVSAARNAGIAAVVAGHTGSPFIKGPPDALMFLDGDDWLAPIALGLLAATLENATWAAAAVGRYARVDSNAVARLSPAPARGCLLEQLLTRNLFANGGHLLIRREAIEAAGDFRSDLAYGEDWEYWTRLAAVGEFVSVPSRSPLLFVRERLAGAYLSRATDPGAYRPALKAIYGNPGLAKRLGTVHLAALGRRAEAEVAWTVGRELVRQGRQREGLRSLGRSFRKAPSLNRLMLMGLSRLRFGPFRPYRTAT